MGNVLVGTRTDRQTDRQGESEEDCSSGVKGDGVLV